MRKIFAALAAVAFAVSVFGGYRPHSARYDYKFKKSYVQPIFRIGDIYEKIFLR